MSADANPIEYWAPATPLPARVLDGPLLTGPDRVGCFTMLGVVVLASMLAMAIVTTLAWVLG